MGAGYWYAGKTLSPAARERQNANRGRVFMSYKLLGNLNDVWTCELLERLSLIISKFDSGVDDDHDDDNVNYTAEQAMIVLSLNSGHVIL